MRKLLIALLITVSLPLAALARTPDPIEVDSRSTGHIVFYVFDSKNTSYGVDAFQDFLYHFGNIEPWLGKNNYSYSFHEEKQISIRTLSGIEILFTVDSFDKGNDIGIILIRSDNSYKMLKGVYTDVDLAVEITTYLGIDLNFDVKE